MHAPVHPDPRTIHRLMYAHQPLQCAEHAPYTHEKTRFHNGLLYQNSHQIATMILKNAFPKSFANLCVHIF